MSLLACLCLRRIVEELCMSVTSIPVDFVGYDIAIMGSGYAGLMAALRLARPAWQLRIALINARDQFIERVRLQESIIEATAPRIPSISTFVAGIAIDFIRGRVTALDPTRRIEVGCCITLAVKGKRREADSGRDRWRCRDEYRGRRRNQNRFAEGRSDPGQQIT